MALGNGQELVGLGRSGDRLTEASSATSVDEEMREVVIDQEMTLLVSCLWVGGEGARMWLSRSGLVVGAAFLCCPISLN